MALVRWFELRTGEDLWPVDVAFRASLGRMFAGSVTYSRVIGRIGGGAKVRGLACTAA